jgi:hypothetical protein
MLGVCSTGMSTVKFGPVLSQGKAVTMQCRPGKDLWRNVDRSMVLCKEFSRPMQCTYHSRYAYIGIDCISLGVLARQKSASYSPVRQYRDLFEIQIANRNNMLPIHLSDYGCN